MGTPPAPPRPPLSPPALYARVGIAVPISLYESSPANSVPVLFLIRLPSKLL